MITLQLMYGLNIYDHVMCVHLHCPLDMTPSTCLQLIVNYDSH